MVETDTSGLVALYTALIQGGATILAVVGGFLLGFGPVRRTGWASTIRGVERTAAEAELRSTESARLLENARAAHGRDILRRLLQRMRGARALRDGRLKQLEAEIEANEGLIEELKRQEAELDAQMDATTDFYLTLQMLLILVAYCVFFPAWLLARLPLDPEPVRRSLRAVIAFAGALLYVADVVAEIGFRGGTYVGDREERSRARTAAE